MTHFIGGNQLKLLRNGAEYFPALETAIEAAKQEIYLQTYIYEADAIGIRIGNLLMQAAIRGVQVNLLLDGFGSKNLPSLFVDNLELAGVRVMFYRPKISPWTLKKKRLRRLHHKVVVVDCKVGFIGGINIIDDFDVPTNRPNNVPPRIDYAVRIEGKIMPTMVLSVHKLWRRISWAHLRAIKTEVRAINTNKLKQRGEAEMANKDAKAALVLRDNMLHRRDIEEAYLAAIAQAKSEIIIANAYFVPGWRFRQALLEAAKRGVKVTLLLQGRMEYFLMFATHAFYSDFLKNGIEIYEYRKSFMHSKVAVIDCYWATVGSSNIDPFSLFLAREANLLIKDATFATELRTDVLTSIQAGAYRISPMEWARGSIAKRFASWLAYGLVRWFLGLIGHANEQ
jgi:cardiolipin synthase